MRYRRVYTASELRAQSTDVRGPGWVVDAGHPGKVFVVGCEVELGKGYTKQLIEKRLAALKGYLAETYPADDYPDFVPQFVVAVEARAAGVLLADTSVLARYNPYVWESGRVAKGRKESPQLLWISTKEVFAGQTMTLRIAPQTEVPFLSFYVVGHPDAPPGQRGAWC